MPAGGRRRRGINRPSANDGRLPSGSSGAAVTTGYAMIGASMTKEAIAVIAAIDMREATFQVCGTAAAIIRT